MMHVCCNISDIFDIEMKNKKKNSIFTLRRKKEKKRKESSIRVHRESNPDQQITESDVLTTVLPRRLK